MGSDDHKLENLSDRIRQAEAKLKPGFSSDPSSRVGWDFAGAVIGSGVIGALLDHVFGTSPWCLLGAIVVGFVVAMTNAWRSIQNLGNKDKTK